MRKSDRSGRMGGEDKFENIRTQTTNKHEHD